MLVQDEPCAYLAEDYKHLGCSSSDCCLQSWSHKNTNDERLIGMRIGRVVVIIAMTSAKYSPYKSGRF